MTPPTERRPLLGVSPTVLALGAVALFMDASSEMVAPILPLFVTGTLGASAVTLGLIEGLAETTSSLLKVISGRASDRGARKPWVVAGYGLAALAKPIVALAGAWPVLLVGRLVDRTGKGIRSAPRDAIIADSTPEAQLGRAFGVHRAMDTLGAAIGPLVAFFALPALGVRGVLWLAVPFAVISAIVAIVFVRERRAEVQMREAAPRVAFPRDPRIVVFLVAVTVFALGNSSDAFLLLRAQDLGVTTLAVPLVFFVFNLVYAAASAPAGVIADRVGRGRVARWGLALFALIYAGFGVANAAWQGWVLFALYGVFMAFTEGVWKAYLGELAPKNARGSVYGAYNALLGLAALPASVIAGLLWDKLSHGAPFLLGAGLALVALLISVTVPARALPLNG